MEDPNKIQVLAKASTEVEESQTRLNLVSLCMKAQQELASKLRKESQRRKEICKFIQNNNIQLETEIKNAEQEIKRSQTNYETIRSANVELNKELLLAKKNNLQLSERMMKGEKKFENLWLECKSRYESIPFVQRLMQGTKKAETLNEELAVLDKETEKLTKEVKTKQNILKVLERKQIIKLAEYVINELPAKSKIIKEKSDEMNELSTEIETIMKEKDIKCDNSSGIAKLNLQQQAETAMVVYDNWPNLSKNSDDLLMMPSLELASEGIDVLSFKLELNKKMTSQNKTQFKRPDCATELGRNLNKRLKMEESGNKEEHMSPYLKKSSIPITSIDDSEYNKNDNYSKKKLINILEDIKLNETETYNIVSRINTNDLQEVGVISSDASKTTVVSRASPEAKVDVDNEEIEVIDLTQLNNTIFPPTQFLDVTQEKIRRSSEDMQVMIQVSLDEPSCSDNNLLQLKSSQEKKKKVLFDMPTTIQEMTNDSIDVSVEQSETPNQTMNSQIEDDVTAETDESYMRIKDMILKKHSLDLSPQFIYTKNSILQKKNENHQNDNKVTSKFFQQLKHTDTAVTSKNDDATVKVTEEEIKEPRKHEDESSNKLQVNTMDVDEPVMSPKNKVKEKAVTGFLFNHGPQGLPESLDVSMSTTGFDEGDLEYPHCLDSSLLLSPKGDDQMADSENNNEIGSQEIPNFLSGFRKTGLSFFGQKSTSENNADNVEQNQENNFNFNFGGQEKKSRGGLFSFFH